MYAGEKATEVNLWIQQGADFSLIIRCVKPNGDVYGLVGYSNPRAKLREYYTSSTAYDFSALVISAEDGEILLRMSNDVTGSIPFRFGVWDLEIEDPDGDVKRIARGRVYIQPAITR